MRVQRACNETRSFPWKVGGVENTGVIRAEAWRGEGERGRAGRAPLSLSPHTLALGLTRARTASSTPPGECRAFSTPQSLPLPCAPSTTGPPSPRSPHPLHPSPFLHTHSKQHPTPSGGRIATNHLGAGCARGEQRKKERERERERERKERGGTGMETGESAARRAGEREGEAKRAGVCASRVARARAGGGRRSFPAPPALCAQVRVQQGASSYDEIEQQQQKKKGQQRAKCTKARLGGRSEKQPRPRE